MPRKKKEEIFEVEKDKEPIEEKIEVKEEANEEPIEEVKAPKREKRKPRKPLTAERKAQLVEQLRKVEKHH